MPAVAAGRVVVAVVVVVVVGPAEAHIDVVPIELPQQPADWVDQVGHQAQAQLFVVVHYPRFGVRAKTDIGRDTDLRCPANRHTFVVWYCSRDKAGSL